MNSIALTAPAELSPAQKAWVTRRARDAQREIIETTKAGVDKPSPLAGEKIVALQIDEDNEIGSGRRLYVVVEIGDRWVTLFHPPQLVNRRVDRLTFDRYARPSPASSPKKTVALIRQMAKTWRQCFPDEHEMACRRGERAIAALKEKTS